MDVASLTWSALLARWVEFAQAAVVLPPEGESGAWKKSVPEVLRLQAVWFALQHLDELPPEERALGIDRAAVLIESSRTMLARDWEGRAMPAELKRLVEDAVSVCEQSKVNSEK
jgi:hypothetical protein